MFAQGGRMSIQAIRTSLIELVNTILNSSPSSHFDPESGMRAGSVRYGSAPKDIVDELGLGQSHSLFLWGKEADQFFNLLSNLSEHTTNGELEHLADRDVERELWRLVCHASLAQVANRQLNAAELVDEFLHRV